MIFLLYKFNYRSPSVSAIDNMSFSEKLVNIPSKACHLFVGICSAAIVFPLVTLVIALGVFFPQEKWEEFWDKFLEI